VVKTGARLRGLDAAAAAQRAAGIRFLFTDCDGVLTDGTVYCSESGEEMLRFSRRDGMGIERLAAAGITTAIVTRERSPIVARRADKLGVQLFSGVRDKGDWLTRWQAESGRTLAGLAYMGDDVNDLPPMAAIAPHGLVAAPADAEPVVAAAVQFLSARPGGAGALREFADFILDLRGLRVSGTESERSKP
jgi:3-deoxy-D-manno-octulosonate 8-phosphate phosphatase (KDO 8-P phosphatase)